MRTVRDVIPLFYIWGLQWMINGGFDLLADSTKYATAFRSGSVICAGLLSIIVLLRSYNSTKADGTINLGEVQHRKFSDFSLTLPFDIFVLSALLVFYVPDVTQFALDIVRVLLLSFFYVWLGVLLARRQLVLLGGWLFVLTVVVAIGYLGFAPLVLESFGGLSLVACGWMLSKWNEVMVKS